MYHPDARVREIIPVIPEKTLLPFHTHQTNSVVYLLIAAAFQHLPGFDIIYAHSSYQIGDFVIFQSPGRDCPDRRHTHISPSLSFCLYHITSAEKSNQKRWDLAALSEKSPLPRQSFLPLEAPPSFIGEETIRNTKNRRENAEPQAHPGVFFIQKTEAPAGLSPADASRRPLSDGTFYFHLFSAGSLPSLSPFLPSPGRRYVFPSAGHTRRGFPNGGTLKKIPLRAFPLAEKAFSQQEKGISVGYYPMG